MCPSGSNIILVFPYQTSWQYSNRGVECRWGMQKSRFWAYIWSNCVLSMLRLAMTKCLWQEVSTLCQRQQNSI